MKSLIESYKKRLEQLKNGEKELYSGEAKVIKQILKKNKKG